MQTVKFSLAVHVLVGSVFSLLLSSYAHSGVVTGVSAVGIQALSQTSGGTSFGSSPVDSQLSGLSTLSVTDFAGLAHAEGGRIDASGTVTASWESASSGSVFVDLSITGDAGTSFFGQGSLLNLPLLSLQGFGQQGIFAHSFFVTRDSFYEFDYNVAGGINGINPNPSFQSRPALTMGFYSNGSLSAGPGFWITNLDIPFGVDESQQLFLQGDRFYTIFLLNGVPSGGFFEDGSIITQADIHWSVVSAVPEPGHFLIMFLGLVLCLFGVWQRSGKANFGQRLDVIRLRLGTCVGKVSRLP